MLSLQTKFVEGSERALIYKYIDIILQSALCSTPHTTPSDKFARDHRQFHTVVELPLWENRVEEARKIVAQTDEDMEWVISVAEKGKARLGNDDAPEEGVQWGDDYVEEMVEICDGELLGARVSCYIYRSLVSNEWSLFVIRSVSSNRHTRWFHGVARVFLDSASSI